MNKKYVAAGLITVFGLVFFTAFQNFTGTLTGDWTRWQNITKFNGTAVSSLTIAFGTNGMGGLTNPSSTTPVIMNFANPGILLPLEQCDYRLRNISEDRRNFTYITAKKIQAGYLGMNLSEGNGRFLTMEFENENQGYPFRSAVLRFTGGVGSNYTQLQVVGSSGYMTGSMGGPAVGSGTGFGFAPSGGYFLGNTGSGGVSSGIPNSGTTGSPTAGGTIPNSGTSNSYLNSGFQSNSTFYLQRRCFIKNVTPVDESNATEFIEARAEVKSK